MCKKAVHIMLVKLTPNKLRNTYCKIRDCHAKITIFETFWKSSNISSSDGIIYFPRQLSEFISKYKKPNASFMSFVLSIFNAAAQEFIGNGQAHSINLSKIWKNVVWFPLPKKH